MDLGIKGKKAIINGGSAGMGGKPFAFKTNTRGGTTMRSAHRDFGVLGYVELIHLNHHTP